MTDLSTPEPIDGPPWPEWTGNAERRCDGHKKSGEQCRRHARRGTNVCDFHGAKAPQVKAKARQRLEEAADRLAKQLLNMATDDNVADNVKLAAIKDALDRGGLGAKAEIELSAKPIAPYEDVMAGATIARGMTRDESRALRGLPPLSAPTPEPITVVEAELVPEPPARPANRDGHTSARYGEPDDGGDDLPRANRDVGLTPGTGLMTLEQANAELASIRTATARRIRRNR